MNGEDAGMDLAEFLLARIGEDETAARAVLAEHPMQDWDAYRSSAGFYEGSAEVFAERFDPARVLAECEAKKKQVSELLSWTDARTTEDQTWALERGDRAEQLAVATLRLLALPYASHSDYRSEWAP